MTVIGAVALHGHDDGGGQIAIIATTTAHARGGRRHLAHARAYARPVLPALVLSLRHHTATNHETVAHEFAMAILLDQDARWVVIGPDGSPEVVEADGFGEFIRQTRSMPVAATSHEP